MVRPGEAERNDVTTYLDTLTNGAHSVTGALQTTGLAIPDVVMTRTP